LIATLFLGGWQVPFLDRLALPAIAVSIIGVVAFVLKVAAILVFYMWVRWTLPRFRYDQLMNLGWKVMLPVALLNLVVTAGWILLWR